MALCFIVAAAAATAGGAQFIFRNLGRGTAPAATASRRADAAGSTLSSAGGGGARAGGRGGSTDAFRAFTQPSLAKYRYTHNNDDDQCS